MKINAACPFQNKPAHTSLTHTHTSHTHLSCEERQHISIILRLVDLHHGFHRSLHIVRDRTRDRKHPVTFISGRRERLFSQD